MPNGILYAFKILLSISYALTHSTFTSDEMATSNNYEISTLDARTHTEKRFLRKYPFKLEYVLKFIAWKCKLRLLSYPFQRHVFLYVQTFFLLECKNEKMCF